MSDFFLGTSAVLLFLLSLFLVFIIMIQRGKGGGIAGSLTGTAQSAFGARGGDLLMWVTIGLTGVWILLSGITIFIYSSPSDSPELDEKGGVTETDSPVIDNSSESSLNSTDVDEELIRESTQSGAQPDVSAEDAGNVPPPPEPLNDESSDDDATPEEGPAP